MNRATGVVLEPLWLCFHCDLYQEMLAAPKREYTGILTPSF